MPEQSDVKSILLLIFAQFKTFCFALLLCFSFSAALAVNSVDKKSPIQDVILRRFCCSSLSRNSSSLLLPPSPKKSRRYSNHPPSRDGGKRQSSGISEGRHRKAGIERNSYRGVLYSTFEECREERTTRTHDSEINYRSAASGILC